jgi:hypothetical protein
MRRKARPGHSGTQPGSRRLRCWRCARDARRYGRGNLAAAGQERHRRILIRPHQPAVFGDVGRQDRRQPPFDPLRHFARSPTAALVERLRPHSSRSRISDIRRLRGLAVDTEFWYRYLCAGGIGILCRQSSPIQCRPMCYGPMSRRCSSPPVRRSRRGEDHGSGSASMAWMPCSTGRTRRRRPKEER